MNKNRNHSFSSTFAVFLHIYIKRKKKGITFMKNEFKIDGIRVKEKTQKSIEREYIMKYIRALYMQANLVSSLNAKEFKEYQQEIANCFSDAADMIELLLYSYEREYDFVNTLSKEIEEINKNLKEQGWEIEETEEL